MKCFLGSTCEESRHTNMGILNIQIGKKLHSLENIQNISQKDFCNLEIFMERSNYIYFVEVKASSYNFQEVKH